jgi:hypothetical protein
MAEEDGRLLATLRESLTLSNDKTQYEAKEKSSGYKLFWAIAMLSSGTSLHVA